jgi:hypothetical protein
MLSKLGRVSLVCLWLAAAGLACNFPGLVEPTATPVQTGLVLTEAINSVVTRGADGQSEAPVVSGQIIPLGAMVETRGQSKARLDVPNGGGTTRLGPDTQLMLLELPVEEVSDLARFGLLAGQVYLILPEGAGAARVETPGGAATLRGPQMGVEYIENYEGTGQGLMRVTCPGGGCTVDNAFGGLELPPGTQTTTLGDEGAFDTFPMDPEEWQKWHENVPEMTAEPPSATPTPTQTLTLAPTVTGTVPPTGTPTETPTETPTGTPTATATRTATRYVITITPTRIIPTTAVPTTAAPSQPSASIWADSNKLDQGQCTTLHWTAGNAKEVYLNGQGIAGETSRQVCPSQTTTYTLRVVGYDNSTAESSTTINVKAASGPPSASISADSNNIDQGQCTTLHWTAGNAKEVYLNGQGIAGETSRQVCPDKTTTYTLHVVGYDNSTADASTTVNVKEPPVSYSDPTISARPGKVEIPEYGAACPNNTNTTISWSAPGASNVVIDVLGAVSNSGSQSVCVTTTTTFTLTAYYPDGSKRSASTTVVAVQLIG